MKCLMKYQWVKLPRNHLPEGKGIMSAWAKLASRAAFRKGQASYCGHINAVIPGMWSGGIVGLKSILGSRSRAQSLEALSKLSELGYVRYSLNAKTKKLTYSIEFSHLFEVIDRRRFTSGFPGTECGLRDAQHLCSYGQL